VTFFSVGMVISRMRKTGTNSKLRNLVVWRYYSYFVIYFFVVVLLVMEVAIINPLTFEHHQKLRESYNQFNQWVYPFLGLAIVITRLAEPYVFSVLRGCCRSKNKKTILSYSNQSLDAFVNSAMNIEYVCLILTAV
jgi:hypothetical protein